MEEAIESRFNGNITDLENDFRVVISNTQV